MSTPAVQKKAGSIAAIEAKLLRIVRATGRISRVELSRELKIAPSTAGIYVDRLIAEGFLLESEKTERRYGRPATLLALNPQGGLFVGVDFEARNIMATSVDFSQAPVQQAHSTIRAKDSAADILARIEQLIEQVIADDARPVLGIGVGVPGTIDPASGIALEYPFIKGWQNVPLGPHLQKRFDAPVFLENNIRAMAMAEMWFGFGRGLRDFVTLGVRSGIAAGIVVNGQVLRGINHQAGEIGHWLCPVPRQLLSNASPESTEPSCEWVWQPETRLEQVASLSAILEAAQRAVDSGTKTSLSQLKSDITIDDFFAAVRENDAFAISLLHAIADVHGWVVSQLSRLFDLECIIFTGPLTELDELFTARVRNTATRFGVGASLQITSSQLGKYNGAVGAAALALHQWKPKR